MMKNMLVSQTLQELSASHMPKCKWLVKHIVYSAGIAFVYVLGKFVINHITYSVEEKQNEPEEPDLDDEVLFFPCEGNHLWNNAYKNERQNERPKHKMIHPNNLRVMQQYLSSAQESLDICVFLITQPNLANTVLQCHKRGVKVRVITDGNMKEATNSKTPGFVQEGIPVIAKTFSYLMHHKFVIIDGKTVMLGSLNWTNQGLYGNWENVIISSLKPFIENYQNEFDRIWMEILSMNTNKKKTLPKLSVQSNDEDETESVSS